MSTVSVLRAPTLPVTALPEPPIAPRPVMRRSSRVQGAALEMLGHAIEYLIDSRLPEGGASRDDAEAVRTLMRCSRAVFEECEAVIPVRQRIGSWVAGQIRRLPV